MNPRTSMAQHEDIIRRTVTEEQLDSLFIGFGETLLVCFYFVRLRKAERTLIWSLALSCFILLTLKFDGFLLIAELIWRCGKCLDGQKEKMSSDTKQYALQI
ncbi:unnamed protein product [Brassica rapa]|uniref:Uncharacterized protein n=1 Tax=Brassica campestris TaxID=3711 RepID=A0A8D9D6A4_BRACM|nr:unnamed protein product [Brassica rapa]